MQGCYLTVTLWEELKHVFLQTHLELQLQLNLEYPEGEDHKLLNYKKVAMAVSYCSYVAICSNAKFTNGLAHVGWLGISNTD